jgi:cellulose synthase/poly-beta-1,6-N-acetylglucosamine synthase-like glycosyltransferase
MANVNRLGFSVISGFNDLAHFIFYASVALGAMRLFWIGALALVHKRRVDRRPASRWLPPSVTAIVPAYNEATVVTKTIRSLLASKYKNLKIIVVDDGSSDGTADVVRQAFGKNSSVEVVTKPNGGKWSALNTGLALATDDIVVMLDADTIFDPNAIGLLVRHFEDATVGAVCGHAVVGNRINMLTRFQALEYATNQNLDRRALELVNGITVVPGAIGAWRSSALQGIGGYEADTLAEDSEATVRLVRAGWRVVCEPEAVARTEAPETVRQFMKQRLRWMFGTFQVACKNVDVLFHGKPKGLAYFGLPNVLVFQFLFTLMAPVVDAMMIWSMIAAFITMPLEASEGARPALQTVATYWLLFQLVEILTVVLAVYLDRRDGIWRLAPLLLVQKFVYRQLLYITAIRVAFTALKGTMQGWGKLTRTGNVSLASPSSA